MNKDKEKLQILKNKLEGNNSVELKNSIVKKINILKSNKIVTK